jgi:spermidine/putrescine-binding protein
MINESSDHYLKDELYDLIKKDESIFDFIQYSLFDGLWYWDLENPENEWMNPRFWQVLGYNPEDMPHTPASWQNIIDPDDLQKAKEMLTLHFQSDEHPTIRL